MPNITTNHAITYTNFIIFYFTSFGPKFVVVFIYYKTTKIVRAL